MMQSNAKSKTERVYHPSVWRLVIFLTVLPILFYLIGWSASYMTEIMHGRMAELSGSLSLFRGFMIALIVGNILIIGFNRDYYAIKIDTHSISGPALAFGTKIISLNQIDYSRVLNQNGLERILRLRRIGDTQGNSFIFTELFFKPEQVIDILKELSYHQNNVRQPE